MDYLDNKRSYSSSTFVQIQENGEGFLVNSWSFVTTNAIVSSSLYITFKLLFHLFFSYKVSLLFRSFSFKSYFPFFLLEGNLQILSFYAISDITLPFQFHIGDKITMCASVFTFCFLVVFSIAGYSYLYTFFKKLIKYFTDNIKISGSIIFYLTIEFGFKNLSMAMIHSLFRRFQMYCLQFGLLSFV